MSNRVKEDDRIERIIRGLLKLPENRRCINCNSLGPQYVCTTFWSFVCTNCSGIHREFTHRVKSVSMAKFTSEEVTALQAGGNERAREIYFKEWDPQRHSFPDSSNLHRLREFIKHVYVDRKYTGGRSVDKLPRLKVGDKEDFYENRKVGAYYNRSRSPHYNERSSPSGRNDDRSLRYVYDERRSPRYAQENSRYGGYKSSPVRFEVVDDRFRDDGLGNSRRSAGSRFSNGESRQGSKSADAHNNMDRSRSPVVCPVTDILGENVAPLQVGKFSTANDGRDNKSTANTQKDPSSRGLGPADDGKPEHKRVNSVSLIDFNTDPEPPDAIAVPQTQQNPVSASFGSSENKASQASNVNTLESLLCELSVPAVVPVGSTSEVPSSGDASSRTPVQGMLALPAAGASTAAPVGHMSAIPNGVGVSVSASTNSVPVPPPNGCAAAAAPVEVAPLLPNGSGDPIVKVNDKQKLSSVLEHQPSASPAADSSASGQQTIPSVGVLDNQPSTSSLAPNAKGHFNACAEQPSQAVSKPVQDTSSGPGSQVEAKSCGRKELPVELFTASCSSIPAQVLCWETVPPQAVGFSTQYHPNVMPMPAFPNSAKSTNPFDLTDETTQAQDQTFVSMAPLEGALPNLSAPTLLCTSSLHTNTPGSMPSQSLSHASAMLPQSPFVSAMSQSANLGQQAPIDLPPARLQDLGNFGSVGSINRNQQVAGRYSAPATPKSFSSMGGNPFG